MKGQCIEAYKAGTIQFYSLWTDINIEVQLTAIQIDGFWETIVYDILAIPVLPTGRPSE